MPQHPYILPLVAVPTALEARELLRVQTATTVSAMSALQALLLLASTSLGILVVEATTRILDVTPRPLSPLPLGFYQLSDDPFVRYEFRPNFESESDPKCEDSKYCGETSDHRGYKTNSDGFRDREYKKEKPSNVYRILVLGDSTTAGNTVSRRRDLYTELLEIGLNRQSRDRTYEVINMGVGGYHTLQEVALLRHKGLAYDPDFVLITACKNDLYLHADGGMFSALTKKNPGINDIQSATGLYNWALRNSRLWFVLHHRIFREWGNQDEDSHPATDAWYLKKLGDKSVVHAGLELLQELGHQYNFESHLIILPVFKDTYLGNEKIFKETARVPYENVDDLLDDFRKADENIEVFSSDSLHMNEYGHRALSEILIPKMLDWIPPEGRAPDSS
jgi:lysophospholipase L1-like esterase